MRKQSNLLLAILFVCFVAVFMIAGIMPGAIPQDQNNNASQRGECEQACTRSYKDCIGATNANRAQCQTDLASCKSNCKKTAPSPSPSLEPTATVTPTP